MIKVIFFVLFLLNANSLLAKEPNKTINLLLHEVSSDIASHAEFPKLNDIFYERRRGNLEVMDESLSQKEIDKRFRTYIEDVYVPRLLLKYTLTYKRMLAEEKDFCTKNAPQNIGLEAKDIPIPSMDVKLRLGLCTYKNGDIVTVDYHTKVRDDDFFVSTRYIFKLLDEHTLKLVDIVERDNTRIPIFVEGI